MLGSILSVILLTAGCSYATDLDKEIGPVVHVSFLYRHGERSPTWVAKNDTDKIEEYWPQGLGQLTKKGMLHHYRLGQWLKKRYSYLIPDGKFNVKTMCTNSTGSERTLMSAQSNLAGMFEPSDGDKFTILNWIPIPVYSTYMEDDKLLYMEKVPCKNYIKEQEQVMKTTSFQNQLNNKSVELCRNLTQLIGQPITTIGDLIEIYTTLSIYDIHGMKLPAWSKTVYPEALKEAVGFAFTIPTWTTKMKRLRSGPLLKTILKTFKEKIDGDATRQSRCSNITAYSAHDTTVANFLNTVGVGNGQLPPFASIAMIELRKSLENKYFVDIMFKNTTDPFADPYLLQIPQCATPCLFETFEDILKPVIPEDWDKECSSGVSSGQVVQVALVLIFALLNLF